MTISIAKNNKPAKIVGVDIDKKFIEIARKNIRFLYQLLVEPNCIFDLLSIEKDGRKFIISAPRAGREEKEVEEMQLMRVSRRIWMRMCREGVED